MGDIPNDLGYGSFATLLMLVQPVTLSQLGHSQKAQRSFYTNKKETSGEKLL